MSRRKPSEGKPDGRLFYGGEKNLVFNYVTDCTTEEIKILVNINRRDLWKERSNRVSGGLSNPEKSDSSGERLIDVN